MPEVWPKRPFGHLTINFDSKRIPVKGSERKSGPYPYYGASGIVDYVDGYLFDGEYLIVAEDGENLRTRQTPVAFMANGRFWVNNHAHIVTATAENETRFLMYALSVADIAGHLTGSAMPKLTQGNLNRIPVIAPALQEQRAITGVLGALDDKIESNRRTSRKLEKVARAIFRAWFVDFEPVKAKASGARSFSGMYQSVFDSLPTRFIESKLGLVPEGWEMLPLDEAMDVNPSRRLAKAIPAPYLDMAQMPTDGHAPTSWSEREPSSGARFMNGDTLVARITPCLENGKTAFVDFLDEGQVACGSTEYIVLRPKPPMPNLYAYLLARTPEFRTFAIQHMTGSSGRQRVPFGALSKFNVAVAPASVMQAFGEAVEPLFSRSSASVRESRALAALRDYLLPKLLSGEVRVGEI